MSRRCRYCEWSRTGAIGEAQPDNREQRQGGSDEACIGVLNNFYKVSEAGLGSKWARCIISSPPARRKINLLSRFSDVMT